MQARGAEATIRLPLSPPVHPPDTRSCLHIRFPIPPRLLIRCRRSERGNLEANVATTIRQKIAAHYITASTEFSNPASLMRNSSFLIWVWLIGDGPPPMRNTPLLIRVWLPLIWNRVFLIWGALPPMRNGSSLIRVCLPPMRKSRFLIWGKASLFREAGYSANSGNTTLRVWSPGSMVESRS